MTRLSIIYSMDVYQQKMRRYLFSSHSEGHIAWLYVLFWNVTVCFHTGLWCCPTCCYSRYNYELPRQVWHSSRRTRIEGGTVYCNVPDEEMVYAVVPQTKHLINCGLLVAAKWWGETTSVDSSCILEGALHSVSTPCFVLLLLFTFGSQWLEECV
jgi:hypothetical protein